MRLGGTLAIASRAESQCISISPGSGYWATARSPMFEFSRSIYPDKNDRLVELVSAIEACLADADELDLALVGIHLNDALLAAKAALL